MGDLRVARSTFHWPHYGIFVLLLVNIQWKWRDSPCRRVTRHCSNILAIIVRYIFMNYHAVYYSTCCVHSRVYWCVLKWFVCNFPVSCLFQLMMTVSGRTVHLCRHGLQISITLAAMQFMLCCLFRFTFDEFQIIKAVTFKDSSISTSNNAQTVGE